MVPDTLMYKIKKAPPLRRVSEALVVVGGKQTTGLFLLALESRFVCFAFSRFKR